MIEGLVKDFVDSGLRMGEQIRHRVLEIPASEAALSVKSILKSDPSANSRYVDAEAEKIGVEELENLAHVMGRPISLVVNPQEGEVYSIRDVGGGGERVYVYFDAVDGTIKPAGLGNDIQGGKIRSANDGAWATGIAFTKPTRKLLEEITLGDFAVSMIYDGNPTLYRSYPQVVFAVPEGSSWKSVELDIGRERVTSNPTPISTTTNKNLGQAMVCYDAFQAFDRNSNTLEDEELAVALYRSLINRNEGGAFDLLRTYGSLGALQRGMFGWPSLEYGPESQGGAFVAINENLPNMIPSVPLVEGAGGIAIDFDGNPLRERKLIQGRTNIIYAANNSMAAHILEHIRKAKKKIGLV